MSEDDTGTRNTRPHPEAVRIANQVGAILRAEDSGAWKREVLLDLQEIKLNQTHHETTMREHKIEDKEHFTKLYATQEQHSKMLNYIIGALIFIASAAGIVTWAIDKWGGK